MASNKVIPGFSFAFRDGGLTPTILQPTTDVVLIIGNALDGPTNKAIRVRNMTDAESIFGPLVYKGDYKNPATDLADGAYSHNTLVKALHEVILGGGGDVLLCRVCGNTAYASGNAVFDGRISFTAKYPGRVYNEVLVRATSGTADEFTLTIQQPISKGASIDITMPLTTKLSDFVNRVNGDSRNGSVLLKISTNGAPTDLVTTLLNLGASGTATEVILDGGTDGTAAAGEDLYTSKVPYYTELTKTYGTFDALVEDEFDVALLTGIYADDQVVDGSGAEITSVAYDFAKFLHTVSSENYPAVGIIGVRPNGKTDIPGCVQYANDNLLARDYGFYNQTARWIKFGPIMKEGFFYPDPDTNETVDIGAYLSVVAGPDVLLSQKELGLYTENGAAVYAGLVSGIQPQSAATNKQLGAIAGVSGAFSKAVQIALNEGMGRDEIRGKLGSAAYVTFKTSSLLGNVVVSDNTASQRDSDWNSLQVRRICHLATHLTKATLLPFIGQPNNIEAQTAMRTQLRNALNRMVEQGALLGGEGNGFRFTIEQDPVQLATGELTVNLFLRPAFQIKFIRVVVNITA